MVSFKKIPNNWKVPGSYAEFDASKASQGLPVQPWRALVAGQKTSGGSGDVGEIYAVTTIERVIELAGRGSELHIMMDSWFAANTTDEVYILIADSTGLIAWAYDLTFKVRGVTTALTNTTIASTLFLYIDGHRVPVTIPKGTDPGGIATAVAAKITELADLPFTAVVDGTNAYQINLVGRNGGIHYGDRPG